MKRIQHILFAVRNPDTTQQPGIDKAVHLARQLGASLELFHAISTPVFMEVEPLTGTSLTELRREALALRLKRLEKHAARLRRRGVDIRCRVDWDYPPHEAIVRRAEAANADLIVAECHQGKRLAPWLMHLTDWELLRTSPVPVLLLKNAQRWHKPVVLAAVDPSHARDKPARLDTAIVGYADGLAKALEGSMEVVHANAPSLVGLVADPMAGGPMLVEACEELRRAGRRRFDRFATRARIPAARRHVMDADPLFAIPRAARKLGADLVVMGAVSRSGLKRVFIGNTAEKVLEALPCDILVIKPARFRRRIDHAPRGMRVAASAPFVALS